MKLSLPERFAGRPRTMVWIMAVLVISLTTMIVAVSFLLRATVANGIYEGIDQEAGEVTQFSIQGVDPATGQAFTTASRFIEVYTARQSSERGELLVAGADGLPDILQVRGRDAGALEELDPDTRERILSPGTSGTLDSNAVGRITYQNIPVQVGETRGFVAVLEFHASREAEINRNIVTLSVLALITLIITGGVVWWVAGRIGEPTERFTEAVAAYRPGLGLRVPEKGSDEYVRLARIANKMIGHAEDAVAVEQRRVGQVAEQLGSRVDALATLLATPHTGPDAEGVRQRAAGEAEVLSRGLDRIGHLASLPLDGTVTREPGIDLRAVVANAVASWTERTTPPARNGVHVLAVGDKPVIGSCDPDLLEQAIHELIDNAVDAS
ncbi:MAG: hypothetical protein Q4F65_14110, partial [Propionibacteriaceae bacterium]|nr:hypothetical protein [Propionibacteriaceae bacterium]